MAPLRVGIDLGAAPLQVGGLVLGKYIVVSGSKDVKVNGSDPPSMQDVVDGVEDARSTVKSYFGVPAFDTAVVVVPNSTSAENREAILFACRLVGINVARDINENVARVINENVAVAAAYAEKTGGSGAKRIAIVSVTGGYLDFTVVTVTTHASSVGGERRHEYIVEAHEVGPEPIDLKKEKQEGHGEQGPGGLLGFAAGAVKTLVVNPLDLAFQFLTHILSSSKIPTEKVDDIVFVGEASKSEKLRYAVKGRFPEATVWEEIPAGEIAAFGAAVVANKDEADKNVEQDDRQE